MTEWGDPAAPEWQDIRRGLAQAPGNKGGDHAMVGMGDRGPSGGRDGVPSDSRGHRLGGPVRPSLARPQERAEADAAAAVREPRLLPGEAAWAWAAAAAAWAAVAWQAGAIIGIWR